MQDSSLLSTVLFKEMMLSGNTQHSEMPSSLAGFLMPFWRQAGETWEHVWPSSALHRGLNSCHHCRASAGDIKHRQLQRQPWASPRGHLSVGLWLIWLVWRILAGHGQNLLITLLLPWHFYLSVMPVPFLWGCHTLSRSFCWKPAWHSLLLAPEINPSVSAEEGQVKGVLGGT